jgi:hypothetical protein
MIRVDMLRKAVIIAIGGKTGKPFLSGICTFWNGRGKNNHPLKKPTAPRFSTKVAATLLGMGKR